MDDLFVMRYDDTTSLPQHYSPNDSSNCMLQESVNRFETEFVDEHSGKRLTVTFLARRASGLPPATSPERGIYTHQLYNTTVCRHWPFGDGPDGTAGGSAKRPPIEVEPTWR